MARREGPIQFDWRKMGPLAVELMGKGAAPETEGHLKAMLWFQKLGALDQETWRRANDLFSGRKFRWIASIPVAVMSALMEAHPSIVTDKEEFYRWLNSEEGRMFRVPYPDRRFSSSGI